MREIHGKTDIELLSKAISDPDFFAMIEGEAATGKNYSIKTLFGAANWPCVRVNFSISSSYESLVGRFAPVDSSEIEENTYKRADVIDNVAGRIEKQNNTLRDSAVHLAENSIPEQSTFQWVDGLLTKAVKHGWAFIADEINAAKAEALMPFNGLTEDRESRYLTIEEKSEVIKPHDRFRMVATRNPKNYAGVGDMNSALESRAYIIPFDYHDKNALKEIVGNRTNIVENCSESELSSLISLVQDIQTQEQQGTEIMTKVSTRDIIKIGRLTDIMSIRNATKTIIIGIADPVDEAALKEMIKTQNF